MASPLRTSGTSSHEGPSIRTAVGSPPSTVARIVVAPASSVVKCLSEVFIWGFGVLFLPCLCVSVSGVLFSVGVCVCDLLIF